MDRRTNGKEEQWDTPLSFIFRYPFEGRGFDPCLFLRLRLRLNVERHSSFVVKVLQALP